MTTTSAIPMGVNWLTTKNSKNIDVRLRFLREVVGEREFEISRVPSGFQHAKLLMSPLGKDVFHFHGDYFYEHEWTLEILVFDIRILKLEFYDLW